MILILDIGKTNKKCFVFDEDYRLVFEQSTHLPETTDEDGDACEDVELLRTWVLESISAILNDPRFQIRAINCTTYGASFVHVSRNAVPGRLLSVPEQPLEVRTPLYNYLKPFPEDLQQQFFDTYGEASKIALETASPILGNLNSGLQLYWLKYRKPLIFNQIKWSLHLPQYIAYLISNVVASEITSIGCHTLLWDFRKNDYHDWVKAEGIVEKFPPMVLRDAVPGQYLHIAEQRSGVHIGSGLHDSSAALIPYLSSFKEPFLLISTGTWCISLNPFNHEPLSPEELAQDCLCYLSYEGKPVKAARYFGGHEHDQAVKKLAAEFGVTEDFYQNQHSVSSDLWDSYTAFMRQLIEKQVLSTRLALGKTSVRRIFVDGGFSKNKTYMQLLATAFPEIEVYAAEVAQATALGGALALHTAWNEKPLPQNLIVLNKIRV